MGGVMKSSVASDRRRGSALLIVLGMFSFMLVSAVAFSVYMRASRAPSSYVRRNSSARHLAKAALARAMDEIDTAIGNDPFPGVGYNHDYGGNGLTQGDRQKNDNWHGHVFTPSNEVAAINTVSTLSLEALGYLPACLIDEVRYWSRHSRTAKWHSFNYGLGQFAFTAVNVSDFFDLNQMTTQGQVLNRNSSPHGRVSPTYLFRSNYDGGSMDDGRSAASAFISAMASGSGLNNDPPIDEVPLVSMMDFNLALGNREIGKISSPFIKRLMGSKGFFYHDLSSVQRQVFMAGGWNSDSNLSFQAYSSLNRINLAYPQFQPFDGYAWFPAQGQASLEHCYNDVSESHPFWRPLNNDLPILTTALLCDYLDYDSVPLSLCIPCTEGVPMICGVELNPNSVECQTEYIQGTPVTPPAAPGAPTVQTRDDICNLKIKIDFNPTITVVYPFRYERPGIPNYEVECYARIFFEEEQATSDSALEDDGLRSTFFDLGTPDQNWSTLVTGAGNASFLEVKCSARLQIPQSMFNDFRSAVGEDREKKAILQQTMRVQIPPTTKQLATLNLQNSGTGWTVVGGTDANQVDFYPRGNLNPANRIDLGNTLANTAAGPVYRPMVAMWVRIKDSNGKTVDMSPAIPAYDSANGFPGNAAVNKFNKATTGAPSATDKSICPAFRFFPQKSTPGITPDGRTGGPYDGTTALPTPITDAPTWKQKAYIANDPRINWAPEQWWVDGSGGDPKDLWFTGVRDFRNTNNWCDPDIFMAVSDQGYLQSMYELLNIPQVLRIRMDAANTAANTANLEWGVFENSSTAQYDGKIRIGVNNVLHRDVMWRTYKSRAFLDGDPQKDRTIWPWGRIDLLPFDETLSGIRVNPYTDITNVMLGAFANMPQDWWAASTNHLAVGKNYMDGTTFTDDYLFDWSCEYVDTCKMARYWMSTFRKEADRLFEADHWCDLFDGYTGNLHDVIDWFDGTVINNTTSNNGLDVQDILQGDMTATDRKFLYGFLKGCFANKSQLFLIFVRAESAAGGGGAGSGARAVALVWRDPSAPMDASGQYKTASGSAESPTYGKDNGSKYLYVDDPRGAEETWRLNERKYPPHKMRILFYHQLD